LPPLPLAGGIVGELLLLLLLLLQSTRSLNLSAPLPTLPLPPLAVADTALLGMTAGTRAAALRSDAEDKEPAEVMEEEEEEEVDEEG